MKIIAYGVRPDEEQLFQEYAEKLGFIIILHSEYLHPNNLHMARDCQGIITMDGEISGDVTADMIREMKDMGIKYMSTRTAGFGGFDRQALKKYGIRFARVPAYSPNSVAEFEVLMTLGLMRHIRLMLQKTSQDDLSLGGLQGTEIRNLTLGFAGTGRIGKTTIDCFSGFKPKRSLAFDLYPDNNLKTVEYVSEKQLLQESDVILLNMPYTSENHHFINNNTLKFVKPTALLINAARGALVDTEAVLEALDRGSLGGYATDVYEHEKPFIYSSPEQHGGIKDELFKRLKSHPKVIYSPHYAFYTDEAVSNMVEISMNNMDEFARNGFSKNEPYPDDLPRPK